MLVRGAIATAILALAALIASLGLWPSAQEGDADPDAVLRAFEDANRPLVIVDVGTLYAGREALFDPREVLPTWHRHARAEAAMVFEATRSCPPRALTAPLSDVALEKAYAWFERTCGGGPPPDELLAAPPYMHPSGKSYAAMAQRADWKMFHVLELAQSGANDDEPRALAGLGSREWLGLLRGSRFVLTRDHLVTPERGPLGLSRLRFYDRDAWEAMAPRRWQRPVTGALGAIAIASVAVLGFAFVRERRRAALDRLHLMRTLTHELRTPAMALGLDIEPLRASFDEVPAHLQEPLLRVSGGIARLHRVIHHSARTLELFEGKGKLASPVAIESAHEMLKDLAAEWPKKIMLECEGNDGAIATDPEWLAVALRNLVENACKHGKAPVLVRVRLEEDALIVRVEDAGELARPKKSDGLGLGLVLVAHIAKALGGTLAREARPTAFVLRISRKGDR